MLQYFSAIIVGPGPGSPENASDIGVVEDLWKLAEEHLIPIFGVCLGLQSLGVEFGARLKRLHVVKHGQISRVHHTEGSIFESVGNIDAVRYHSLHIELREDGDIEELAWADDEENGRVVMAVKHRTRPFYAVQYHPESVCTDGGGLQVIRNFWRLACQWSKKNGRNAQPWNPMVRQAMGNPWPHPQLSPHPSISPSLSNISTTVLDLPALSVTTVCESFGVLQDSSSFVLLDSAAQPGRFSIVASLTPSPTQITYFVGDTFVRINHGTVCTREDLGSHDIWSWLMSFMRNKKARGGSPDIPFWGGLIGSLSYELGVHFSNIPLHHRNVTGACRVPHPDVNLVFVERSVVLDSSTGKVYLQTLIPNDDAWISSSAKTLRMAADQDNQSNDHVKPSPPPSTIATVTLPDKALYISRIKQAKEYLFSGDSYELCLTAHTRIAVPTSPSSTSWERYKSLRRSNPAPHSAYLRLHPTTLLSSSPERFLSFSRPPGTVCQLRPIKGTVRKGTGITRTVAEHALVGSTKEVAENLMIVDLIRHDLHGVVGDNVVVKQFCQVEEYETVWQLVSVIEGQDSVDLSPDSEVGPEVLRRSLPPGKHFFFWQCLGLTNCSLYLQEV